MEAIYVVLLLALFSVGSLLMEQVRRRLRIIYERERMGRQTPPTTTEIPRPPPPEIEDRARQRASPAPRLPAPEPGARARLRATLKNRAHLRQAIIWMTILGPCRAQDPYA